MKYLPRAIGRGWGLEHEADSRLTEEYAVTLLAHLAPMC
jgi:hypothetical protein